MAGGPVSAGGGIGGGAVPKSKIAGIALASFAAFGGILFGYDTGVIAGLKEMPVFLATFGEATGEPKKPFALTTQNESLIVSILSAGTFFGALLGSPVADHIGRRFGIIFACVVFCVGVAMQTASHTVPLMVVGRVFAGLGVGLVSMLIPMYQSEVSPKWIRGAVVGAYQWAITIGILLATIVNNSTKDRTDRSSYQIPIAIQFAYALILVLGMLYLPESPRWLIKRGRDADAAKALGRLTSLPATDPVVELELEEIRSNLQAELALGETSYKDCFSGGPNKIRLRTLTGIFIQAWQQLTGINFIFYFSTTFFTQSGFENPFLISIVTGVVNVVCTLPGMWAIERFGRRRLLLVGAVGMCICEFLVAIIGVTVDAGNRSAQKALVALICIYIAHFAATWGPVAWVITGEIFPLAIRAKAMSLSVASNWLWNFGIGYATPYLVNDAPGSAGLGVKVFFLWGATCAGCVVFTYFCVPETKGLSLEQIDTMYRNTTPVKSLAYRRQLIADGDGEFVSAGNKNDFAHTERTSDAEKV